LGRVKTGRLGEGEKVLADKFSENLLFRKNARGTLKGGNRGGFLGVETAAPIDG